MAATNYDNQHFVYQEEYNPRGRGRHTTGPPSNRGRGRGNQDGRGRGRGRGQDREFGDYPRRDFVPTQDMLPPSRRTKVDGKKDPFPKQQTPTDEKSKGPALSIPALSKLIEKSFPSMAKPAAAFQHVLINANRYVELCRVTYARLVAIDHRSPDYLSEREFLLVMGWLLVKRVQDAQPYGKDPAISDFCDKVNGLPVPAPIEEYLKFITPTTSSTGLRVYPDLIIPGQQAVGNWNTVSTLPLRLSNQAQVDNSFAPSMFPFWLLWRGMVAQAGLQVDGHAVVVHQHDMTAPAIAADVYFADNFAVSSATGVGEERAPRTMTQARLDAMMPDGYDGAFFFDSTILPSYYHFVSRVNRKYEFRDFPTGFGDSKSILGWSEVLSPGPNNLARPIRWLVLSQGEMDKVDYYAVQLFQYRRVFRTPVGRVHLDQFNADLEAVPAQLRPPAGIEYDTAQDDRAFLSMYVEAYIIEQR